MKNSKRFVVTIALLGSTAGAFFSYSTQASEDMGYPAHLQSSYGSVVTDNFNNCVGLGAGEMSSYNQCGVTPAPEMKKEMPAVMPKPQAHAPMVMHHPDITLSADALFDFNKAILKPQGKTAINRELAKINHRSNRAIKGIKIVGYTDSVGTKQYNLKLSLKRAEAVKAYLVQKGINAQIVRVNGLGMADPVASNSTKEGRAKNRRAEIYITYK